MLRDCAKNRGLHGLSALVFLHQRGFCHVTAVNPSKSNSLKVIRAYWKRSVLLPLFYIFPWYEMKGYWQIERKRENIENQRIVFLWLLIPIGGLPLDRKLIEFSFDAFQKDFPSHFVLINFEVEIWVKCASSGIRTLKWKQQQYLYFKSI